MPRNKKYWKRRLGPMITPDMPPYVRHFDLRRIDDLDDEGLAYTITYVKGIDMLDLNETEITNKSIQLLTKLEYIKELRLKSIREIDDDCADDLNKITSLEFLHLRFTGFTIDGVLKLNALTNLKRIIFTADNINDIKDKMLQLKRMLPNCELLPNSRPYEFEDPNTPGSAPNTPAN
jgi:hypothetical protein